MLLEKYDTAKFLSITQNSIVYIVPMALCWHVNPLSLNKGTEFGCFLGVRVYMYGVHVLETQGWHQESLGLLSTLVLQVGSLLILEYTHAGSLISQSAPGILSGITGGCHATWHLSGFWGSELQPLCLCSKHFILWAITQSPSCGSDEKQTSEGWKYCQHQWAAHSLCKAEQGSECHFSEL